MSLTREIRERAISLGADLVGIAPIDRFAEAPPAHDPVRLFPETQSLVSIAIRHLRGVTVTQQRLIDNYPYQIFGYGWLSHIRLNTILFELARLLEDRGHLALPYPSFCESDPLRGHEAAGPDPAPPHASISNRHVAVAAGLGRFGLCNLVLTPKYATRQRFGTLLTTAPLEPDPLVTDSLCDNCQACVQACPANAIGAEPEVSFRIGDQVSEVAQLDRPRCYWYHFGLSSNTYGPLEIPEPENLTREVFEQHLKDALSQSRFLLDRYIKTFAPAGYCGMCLIACPKGNYHPS